MLITILLSSHPYQALPKVSQVSSFFRLPGFTDLCHFPSACPSFYIHASNSFSTCTSLKQKLKIQRLSPHKIVFSQLPNSSLFILIKPARKSVKDDQGNWMLAAMKNLLKCLLEAWHALYVTKASLPNSVFS